MLFQTMHKRHLQRGNVLLRSVLGGLVIERED
jgi:hypothetical protein